MQVRLLMLQGVHKGAQRETQEGRGGDRKRGGNREKNGEGGESALGGGQSPGESLRNRQNSKWVFEEVKAETRLVSSGGGGEVGEL